MKRNNLSALFIFLSVLFVPIFVPCRAGAEGIELPLSGWRLNRCTDPDFLQMVSYPASDVNLDENTCEDNIISGSFTEDFSEEVAAEETDEYADAEATAEDRALSESDAPATLVVNGNFMPQSMNGAGFSRPFAFGKGSNSVAIKKDGKMLKRQFYETSTTMTAPDLRVILSWNTDDTDLDLHVVTPDGGHCWYGERALKNGGALDVDVTTGYGPEIFTMASPVPGLYGVYVNYYGSGDDTMTIVKVDVIMHESTLDEKRITKTVPLSRAGDLVSVAEFTY